ncbi:hypothetical protein RhiJN_28553 [Ceratobasidium sp. AG-Ba]|nr:hypothetical protein RhiJN_28553 [Ceratobasidium sp. AG-Ba]
MEPPKLPPKRTRLLDSATIRGEVGGFDDWQHKRQRALNDEHVTRRRPPSGRQGLGPRPENRASPSSLQANSSFSKSVSSTSTHILPGGFPSKGTDSSDSDPWSPWISDTSVVKIFWTRAFMSVRSTLADAFSRLARSREEERRSNTGSPKSVTFAPEAPDTRPTVRLSERRLAAPSVVHAVLEEAEGSQDSDQEEDDGSGYTSELEIHPLDAPQSTIALGGHTIQLTSPRGPRLLSGIRLTIPDSDSAWPPPRRLIIPRVPELEASGGTEIDPDAQKRPECGFRDQTPSVHANSLYEMS